MPVRVATAVPLAGRQVELLDHQRMVDSLSYVNRARKVTPLAGPSLPVGSYDTMWDADGPSVNLTGFAVAAATIQGWSRRADQACR